MPFALSCNALCPVLPNALTFALHNTFLPCPALSYPVPAPALLNPALPCPTVSCSALPCPFPCPCPCPTQPCRALLVTTVTVSVLSLPLPCPCTSTCHFHCPSPAPAPAVSIPALSYAALPFLALPCRAMPCHCIHGLYLPPCFALLPCPPPCSAPWPALNTVRPLPYCQTYARIPTIFSLIPDPDQNKEDASFISVVHTLWRVY